MSTRLWDTYNALGITGRNSRYMLCVGLTSNGEHCTIEIENIPYTSIRRIIDKMESCPPDESRWPKTLNKLASISLCSTCQDLQLTDLDELVDEWKRCIIQAVQRYRKRMGRLEVETQLRKIEEENKELKRTVETLENRGICKLHIEIETLQSQLAAERIDHAAAAALAISEQKASCEEVTSLISQLNLSRDRVAELSQELGAAKTENKILSLEIEELRSGQVSLENTNKKFSVDLANTKAENSFLVWKAVGLEDTLEKERNTSSASLLRLQGRLEATIISRVKLRKTEISLLSQLGESTRKLRDFSNVTFQLKTDMRILAAANDELQSSAEMREKNTAAVIAILTRRIDFVKSHPFNMFLISLMVSVKGWEGIVARRLGWLGSWVPVLF